MPAAPPTAALGLFEVRSWTAALVSLDAMEKAAPVRLLQVELNDMLGACIKVTGDTAAVSAALAAATAIAGAMHADHTADLLPAPAPGSLPAYRPPPDFNPLINQPTIHEPTKDDPMPDAPFAIGIIETQGLTAVIEAIDTATKAANVDVLAREKLGGGYIAVVIKGDVAAVRAAVDAGKAKVEGLGKLVAAHVIPRPSAAVLSLLPKV